MKSFDLESTNPENQDNDNQLNLEKEIHTALEKNELNIMYQPQMNIETGEIVGLEALLRWNHPIHGSISPSTFIPIAEETGVIHKMGEWVFKQTLSDFCQWAEAGLKPIPLAINISGQQLMSSKVVEYIENTLSQYQLDPKWVEIEITESVMIDQKSSISYLHHLHDLGIKICMDDFGTGYSSLHYLKKLPVYKLKIDRLFISDITSNQKDENIIKMIMMIAQIFDLKVVAEGVETKEQLSKLQHLGCHDIQGYLFSPPLTSKEVLHCLENSKRSINQCS